MYLPIALFLLNLLSFLLFGIDKRRARKGLWRIPEKTLLLSCALFSAAGGLLGMKVFHHKTRKPRFRFGVPALLVLECALAILIGLHFGSSML